MPYGEATCTKLFTSTNYNNKTVQISKVKAELHYNTICINFKTHTCTHSHKHAYIHIKTHTHKHSHASHFICIPAHTHTHVHMYAPMQAYKYKHTYRHTNLVTGGHKCANIFLAMQISMEIQPCTQTDIHMQVCSHAS